MSSELGRLLKLTLFGESHGAAVGAVLSGLPSGERIDRDALRRLLVRRSAAGELASGRRESDSVRFLSGVRDGATTGTPLCLVIDNEDARPADYAKLQTRPRPGHADLAAICLYGKQADLAGGGHFSGRLTAPLCAAGGIALQILARRGIVIAAHLDSASDVHDAPFPPSPEAKLLTTLLQKPFPVLDDDAGARMRDRLRTAKEAGDSVGGVVECAAVGVEAGLGGPLFDGVESRLSEALFGIPAVKGVEFGAGFAAASLLGSQNNDPFYLDETGRVRTRGNHAGGILGGVTNGEALVVRVAVKPTPSIGKTQDTLDLTDGQVKPLSIGGRHDPCVALRAVPVVEACCAFVILDMLTEWEGRRP